MVSDISKERQKKVKLPIGRRSVILRGRGVFEINLDTLRMDRPLQIDSVFLDPIPDGHPGDA